jgi:predicted DNA binding CopG/RHH family protein
MVDREKRINVRVSEAEAEMLNELAEREGVSQSDYIRLFIRRAHAETFGSTKAPRKPKR